MACFSFSPISSVFFTRVTHRSKKNTLGTNVSFFFSSCLFFPSFHCLSSIYLFTLGRVTDRSAHLRIYLSSNSYLPVSRPVNGPRAQRLFSLLARCRACVCKKLTRETGKRTSGLGDAGGRLSLQGTFP